MNKALLKVKTSFKDQALFEQSLTHRSWVNENKHARETNERLEFLGDAVLEFVVSDHLYRNFTDKEEGYLTALRANLVNTQNLAQVAQNLEIGNDIFLSKGEAEGGGRENQSLLADTVEAIIGAIFLDLGLKAASNFITAHILSDVDKKTQLPLKDAKSRLQEQVQSQGKPTPKYRVVEESGPDHAKNFLVEVTVDTLSLGQGKGRNKSIAEQEAAQNALEKMVKLG